MTQIFLSYCLFEFEIEVTFVVFARLRLRALKNRTANCEAPARAACVSTWLLLLLGQVKVAVGGRVKCEAAKEFGQKEGIWSDQIWSDDYLLRTLIRRK